VFHVWTSCHTKEIINSSKAGTLSSVVFETSEVTNTLLGIKQMLLRMFEGAIPHEEQKSMLSLTHKHTSVFLWKVLPTTS
jgi:hypothetical protein